MHEENLERDALVGVVSASLQVKGTCQWSMGMLGAGAEGAGDEQ
jgi:hypothetical protein